MSNKPIKLWQYLVPIVVLLAIWFYPVPEGLKPQAWHMFAIFVATIVGILCAPLPSGALMFIALALSIFTNGCFLQDPLRCCHLLPVRSG